MKTLAVSVALVGVWVAVGSQDAHTGSMGPKPVAIAGSPSVVASTPAPERNTASSVSSEALTVVVRTYCQVCHNDQLMSGNVSLAGFDVDRADESVETAERMIRKLRAGMMPPPGMPRPAGDTLLALVETLENVVDEAAAANPNPGNRRFQRLNRAEYERVIQDLSRYRGGRGQLAALGHVSGQLRQPVGSAGALHDPLGGISEGRCRDQSAGRRRSECSACHSHLQDGPGGVAARVGSCGGCAVRYTRWAGRES